MPLSLANMAVDTAKVEIPYGSETVNVVYFPSRITEETLTVLDGFDVTNVGSVMSGFKALNETLAHLIKSWDIYEDAKNTIMFPVDAEKMPKLPIPLRMAILSGIMGDMRPNDGMPQ